MSEYGVNENGKIYFDNTLEVKKSAEKNMEKILANTGIGHEVFEFEIGQTVDGNGFGFKWSKIASVYKENGYCYYRLHNGQTLRQKDIHLLEFKRKSEYRPDRHKTPKGQK